MRTFDHCPYMWYHQDIFIIEIGCCLLSVEFTETRSSCRLVQTRLLNSHKAVNNHVSAFFRALQPQFWIVPFFVIFQNVTSFKRYWANVGTICIRIQETDFYGTSNINNIYSSEVRIILSLLIREMLRLRHSGELWRNLNIEHRRRRTALTESSRELVAGTSSR